MLRLLGTIMWQVSLVQFYIVNQLTSGIRVLPYTTSISKLISIDGNTWKSNRNIIHCINFLTVHSQSFKSRLSFKIYPLYVCVCVCLRLNPISSPTSFPGSLERRDPGRVSSRASVTIENTREGSSLNKEFVDVLHSIYFKS